MFRLTSTNSLFSLLQLSLLLLLSTGPPPVHCAKCNRDDKKALLSIKESFGNPYHLASWTNTTGCCDWYDVDCDPTTSRVIGLSIFQANISGQIPPAVGDLPYLETLVLRHITDLHGQIAPEIAKLTKLKMIRLSWTNLSGPIPSFFGSLSNLNYLDLSYNQLTGSIPPSLGSLPLLQALHLDRNMLTGGIPESLGTYSKSSPPDLILSHNSLTGTIPKSLGDLNFRVIDLSRNQLSGDASLLFGASKTSQQIDISRNLFAFDLSAVEFPVGLDVLDLNHNKIYGKIPAQVTKLESLQFFNVSYNRLCGEIPSGGNLGRFDQYSFFHNRCLCGPPLPSCT